MSKKVGDAGNAEQRDARSRVLAQQAAAADESAYAEGLKARHNVKILNADFQKPTVEARHGREGRAAGRAQSSAQPASARAAARKMAGSSLASTSGCAWGDRVKLRPIDRRYAGS